MTDSRPRAHGPYKVLSSEPRYRNRWIAVREDRVIRPGGSEGLFGVVEMVPGSSVLAIDGENNAYLVREYKYALGARQPGGDQRRPRRRRNAARRRAAGTARGSRPHGRRMAGVRRGRSVHDGDPVPQSPVSGERPLAHGCRAGRRRGAGARQAAVRRGAADGARAARSATPRAASSSCGRRGCSGDSLTPPVRRPAAGPRRRVRPGRRCRRVGRRPRSRAAPSRGRRFPARPRRAR